ncbi:hypothetical protein GCM10023314_24480 [Algibacter agarivorans]|uniref:Secretion system C-terminal sorting domain-containing protein n=1 Tax=Algibacter agarivorans TaxID=1109741 RepID=A0ABP9GQF6_9FLAO
MKKITLKINAFLCLTMFALQVQAQTWTENGTYKISTSGLTPELFMTISTTTGDLVWAEELAGEDPTQVWYIVDHRLPASAGYMEITANIPGPGDFTMIVDQATIDLADPNDKNFRISVRPGLPIDDAGDPNYGFDQFQRRKTNPAPPVGNNALFVKPPAPISGGSRYGVIPATAGEDVLFDGGGIDELKFYLIAALSTKDFDTSSIFISNPVNNELSIKGLTSNVKQVSVYSLLGKEVISREVNEQSALKINVSALSSGMYLVKMQGDNGSFTKKIVKQ